MVEDRRPAPQTFFRITRLAGRAITATMQTTFDPPIQKVDCPFIPWMCDLNRSPPTRRPYTRGTFPRAQVPGICDGSLIAKIPW